jgi:signal transduction histidine kinase/DNA-binding NarL/FixJ family response regulator
MPMRAIAPAQLGGKLFRKYVLPFAGVLCAALVVNGLLDIWFSYREQTALLIRIQREQAESIAAKIDQFIKEIETQVGWTTQHPWSAATLEQRRFDGLLLLRQVPAITELAQLDSAGRERLRVSRVAMDLIDSQSDRSQEAAFVEAVARRVYHGPVYFRQESQPYMTLSVVGARREAGVSLAEVNLAFIWDVVTQTKVGERGRAYVIDEGGRLIAHPDISLVLSNSDLSQLGQVRAAQAAGTEAAPDQEAVESIEGERVLSASASVPTLGWLVFVELPVAEAYAPIYATLRRSGTLLAAALALALLASILLARRMVAPIQALRMGAERIGSGDLAQRISIKTGDELEALGDQFNSMAIRLEESYATLERKVEERTHQLELANLARSRFLAVATHDLRQPLQALGLFVAQLRTRVDDQERDHLIERTDAAVAAMNELFQALLDISKLDAGVLTPDLSEFPVDRLLKRIETTFAAAAREKGLRLRVVSSSAWVRSDFIMLERILLNLASNAVRYTAQGGVVIGCRQRGAQVRIDICDSGIGIAEDQQRNVFAEFYRLGGPDRERTGGLGLGLAIVDRLGRLLDHTIGLTSQLGRGTRFSVSIPSAASREKMSESLLLVEPIADIARGKLIVIIDDDEIVLDSMRGLLRGWGCRVVAAQSDSAALASLANHDRRPDLIISDYQLANGGTGFEAIERLRSALGSPIPAFLISGDTAPERLREARASGYHLLHKPIGPAALRATLNHLMRDRRKTGEQLQEMTSPGTPTTHSSVASPTPEPRPQ